MVYPLISALGAGDWLEVPDESGSNKLKKTRGRRKEGKENEPYFEIKFFFLLTDIQIYIFREYCDILKYSYTLQAENIRALINTLYIITV